MANFYATYSAGGGGGGGGGPSTVTANQGTPGGSPWPVSITGPIVGGRSTVSLVRNIYSGTNVTTAAYVQIIASTPADMGKQYIFDSSGSAMILAVGAMGSEVDKLYIGPGGNTFDLSIPSGSRVSLKALDNNATNGQFIMTGLS